MTDLCQLEDDLYAALERNGIDGNLAQGLIDSLECVGAISYDMEEA